MTIDPSLTTVIPPPSEPTTKCTVEFFYPGQPTPSGRIAAKAKFAIIARGFGCTPPWQRALRHVARGISAGIKGTTAPMPLYDGLVPTVGRIAQLHAELNAAVGRAQCPHCRYPCLLTKDASKWRCQTCKITFRLPLRNQEMPALLRAITDAGQ